MAWFLHLRDTGYTEHIDREEAKNNMSTSADAAQSAVILLVEDESMVREITGDVLSHAGYRVLASGTPGDALRVAKTHNGRIDLLLTDVVMPEMNGADLASRLRDRQPDLVTVFMSGYARHDVLHKDSMASAVHIQKPFTVDTLLSRVAKALQANERPACASSGTSVSDVGDAGFAVPADRGLRLVRGSEGAGD